MQSISPLSTQELMKWGAQHLKGPHEGSASSVGLPEASLPGAIVFVKAGGKPTSLEHLGILIVSPDYDLQSLSLPLELPVFATSDFRGLMARCLAHFDRKIQSFPEGRDPTASIHPDAILGQDVRIGAHAVIQAGARIGDKAWIGAGVIIEAEAVVGAGSILHSNVVLGHHCQIGIKCVIHSNTCIGSDGFGFIPAKRDEAGARPIKIPQIGRVILGDEVEIGANCALDRGAIGDTQIGHGTKMDNLCHVAHNCRIGENGLIAGGFFIAGSSNIGDRFSCGGNVAIADHVNITADVTLGGRSAVTKDIDKPGLYTGYPLEPFSDGMRTTASLRELTRMRKDLADLKRQMASLKK